MTRRKAVLAAAVIAAFVALVPHTARAVSVPDLLAGATVTAGDKLFSNFDLAIEIFGPLDLTPVEVVPTVSALGEGLVFLGLPSIPGLGGEALTFTVTVLDPNFLITDIAAEITGEGEMGAQAGIGVTIFDPTEVVVSATLSDPSAVTDLDNPVATATMSLLIVLFGDGAADNVSVESFGFFLSQTRVDRVPEPSMLLLLTAGAGALAFGVRRFRS